MNRMITDLATITAAREDMMNYKWEQRMKADDRAKKRAEYFKGQKSEEWPLTYARRMEQLEEGTWETTAGPRAPLECWGCGRPGH